MKITKWKEIDSKIELRANIFRYKKVKRESPTTGQVGEFDIVECLNWVNVVAITEDNQVVLVKQFRHGNSEITLEIPGGAVHFDEDTLLAAKRELREESGYTSNEWSFLGKLAANPAFMSNTCTTYLALNAKKTHDLELDPFEEIEVVLVEREKILPMIKSGEIDHSLVVAGLLLADCG